MRTQKSLKYLTFLVSTGLASGLMLENQGLAREDSVPGSRYTSARSAGLADAALPLADDGASSLFTNPAGFGNVRGTVVEPINFTAAANTEYTNMIDRNFYKVTSLSSYAPTVSGKPGAYPGFSGSLCPTFATRGFGLGI